ncbi:hypothetical protein D3C79_821470 [compost metagenome]
MVDLLGLGLDFDGQQDTGLLGGLLLLDLVSPCASGSGRIGEVGQRYGYLAFQFLPAVDDFCPMFVAVPGHHQMGVTLNQVVDIDWAAAGSLAPAFTT